MSDIEPRRHRHDADDDFDDDALDDDALDDDELDDEDLDLVDLDDSHHSDDFADEAVLDVETLFTPRTTLSAAEAVNQLVQNPNAPTGNDLFALSDLSRQDAELVRQAWPTIPADRRRTVMRQLIDLAVDDLDWHLSRILRIGLEDEDAQVRQLAIEGLWEDQSADLIGVLTQLLRNDPQVDVRAAAAAALGGYVLAGELDEMDAALAMRAEESLLAVLNSVDEPPVVQARALESIAYSGEAGVRQLIEDAYYSPEETLRVSSLVSMGRSADVHWRSYARAELLNPAAAMRAEAARACGELEAKSATRQLLELLVDEEQTVRLAAIFALGRIGGRDARAALRLLGDSENPAEAAAATEALEEMAFYADPNFVALVGDEVDQENDDESDDDEWDDEPWSSGDRDNLGEYGKD